MSKLHTFFTAYQIRDLHPHAKLVLATGFFDLCHSEHINFLTKAHQQGDLLVVGVESDHRARLLKGHHRPFQPQLQRALHLTSFSFVDYVILLPSNFSLPSLRKKLIFLLHPQVLAVSSHTPNLSAKKRLLNKVGGVLQVVHSQNPAISTTLLAQKKYNTAN